MKTLIINRTKDTNRYSFQTKQLERLGIDYERITATEVDNLTEEDKTKFQNNWQRPLRHTEIACTFSHHQCWSIVAETGKAHFIIEDDAVMCKHTKSILDKLAGNTDFDIVSLETRDRHKFISKESSDLGNDYTLHSMLYDKGGAAGYILWPSGAKKLMAHKVSDGVSPADAFLGDCRNLIRGQVNPAPVLQLDVCLRYDLEPPCETLSSIFTQEHQRPKADNLKTYLTCRYRRIKAQVKLFTSVQLKQLFSSKYFSHYIPIKKKDFQV